MRLQTKERRQNAHGRPCFGLLSCLFLFLFCGCASKEPASAAPDMQTPAEPSVRTFRIPPFFIEDHPNLCWDVPVKNETSRTVNFSRVRQSCTCMGTVNLECKELAPGQETILHFDIEVSHRKGNQRFICYLVEVGGSEWTYELETTLYERARFMPDGPIHFGMVNPKAEEVRSMELRLYSASSEELPREVAFRSDSDSLRIEAGPGNTEHLPDGFFLRTIPLTIHLKASATPGLQNVSLHAKYLWGTEKLEVVTGVDWNVRTLISVVPSQVYFGSIDSASPEHIERRVTLQSPNGRSLTVKKVITSHPTQVHCRIDGPSKGPTVQILLVLDAKTVKKPLWGEVVVEIEDPLQPSVKVPMAALPKQVP